eukprot:TRINITY_DN36117_c0_g1_i1.p1 TRINITY_DN36117_c0_g1~~TRINITY_DN36117_c0_g1_i1.p1  ORF type:complete len:156 (-),score=12.80 TRINITY_DN36117_c0_g1_i1:116-559(-)
MYATPSYSSAYPAATSTALIPAESMAVVQAPVYAAAPAPVVQYQQPAPVVVAPPAPASPPRPVWPRPTHRQPRLKHNQKLPQNMTLRAEMIREQGYVSSNEIPPSYITDGYSVQPYDVQQARRNMPAMVPTAQTDGMAFQHQVLGLR